MFLRRLLCIWITISFVATLVIPPQRAYAQTILNLPEPGEMVNLSPAYTPVLIKGLKINPSNPLALDFIVATGDSQLTAQDPRLKKESEKLIKYFFAALTLPEKDVWVNLSPYEKDRIIPQATGETEMGRDMLAQDYILKQITASLIYPEKGLGKDFWNKIYTEAYQRFGTTQIPVNTFNKVWIVADKASVYEAKDTVFVVDSHLKVMLDEDYRALTKHQQLQPVNATHALGSQVVREIVLPALEKEVNEGKNFASLRQIFHSLILAKWYKETLKTALLNQVYSNKDKISGVDVADKAIKEKIYQQYLQAYKKGVFNYIKEDKSLDSSPEDQPIARKYFSGGVDAAMVINHLTSTEFLSRAAKGLFSGLLLNIAVTAHAQNLSPSSTQLVISASTVELSKKDKEKLDGYLAGGFLAFSFMAAAVTASTLFAAGSLKTENSVSGPTKNYDVAMAADENESVAQMLAWDLKGYHSVDMEPFKEAIPPEYQLKAQQGISEVPPGHIGIALKAKSFDVDPETGIPVPRLAVPYYGFVLAEQEMVGLLHQMAAYNMPVTKRLVARIMGGRDINLGAANADLFEQQERDAAMEGEAENENIFAARQTLLAFYDHTQANGHTARLLEWLPSEQQQKLLVHLFKRNYHGIYIAPDVSNQDLLEWVDSGFTAPVILERRVDNTTLNIERSRAVVKNVNGNIVKELAEYLRKARVEGYFGVMSTAMEMPVVYQEGPRKGRKMSRAGPGGGGEGIFKNDLSAALREKGLGFAVTAPLFLADLVKDFPDDIYPTLDSKIDAYLKEINGAKLMDIELPLGNGAYPFSVFYYKQRGVPVIQIFDRSGNLFNTLYKQPNPDSAGGYMEAVLLPLASIEIPRQIGLQFEVYHFHDWQATLGNMLLSRMYADQEWPLGYRPARVQTMHNLEPQGRFMGQESLAADPKLYRELVNRHIIPAGSSNVVDLFALTNLDAYKGDGGGSLRDRRGGQGLEFYNNGDGQHLLIRSAEAGPADGVLFVSEGHMREALAGGKRSFGLEGMFQHLNEMGISVKGIHNGIFAKDNLPENLTALKGTEAATYGFVAPDRSLREYDDAGKAEWKRLNKLALQKKLNALYNKDFEINDKNILLGIPTRIVKQKGLNLMMQKLKINGRVKTLLEHILDQKDPKTGAKVQFVVLGTPGANDPWGAEQAKFFREFLQLHPEYKDRFVFVEKFDGVLAKQIGAGSDLFPMTSIDEPGGIANSELALLLSLGIISNRGGLNDAFEKGMTPFKLIPGYEVDGPNDVADLNSIAGPKLREAVHQRQIAAQAMIEIISGFVKVFAGYRQGKKVSRDKYLGYLNMVAAYDPDWGARTDDYTDFYRSLIKRAQTHPDRHFDAAMTGEIPLLAAIARTHPINFNGLMGFLTFNTQERLRRNKTNTTKKEIESGDNIGLVLDNRFVDQDAIEKFRPEARFEGVLVRQNEFIGLLQQMVRNSDKGRQAVENLIQYWLPDQAMTFRVPPKEIGLGDETQMFVPSVGKFEMIKISSGADSRPILLVGTRNVYTFATLPQGDKRAVAVSIWGQALFIKDGSSIFARKIDIHEGVVQLFSVPLLRASDLQAPELELGETPESWIPFDAAWAGFRGSVKGAKDFFLKINDGKVLAGFVLPSGSIVASDITSTYPSIFPDKAMEVKGDDVHFANGWVSSKGKVTNMLGEIRTSLARNHYRTFRFLYDHEDENLMKGISLEFNEQGVQSKIIEEKHIFVIPAGQKPEAFGVLERMGAEIKSDVAMKAGVLPVPQAIRTPGGIDFNASKLKLQKTGSGIDIKFDPAMIVQFKLGNFAGILPVITGITPIANIYPLLGLKEPEKVTA